MFKRDFRVTVSYTSLSCFVCSLKIALITPTFGSRSVQHFHTTHSYAILLCFHVGDIDEYTRYNTGAYVTN